MKWIINEREVDTRRRPTNQQQSSNSQLGLIALLWRCRKDQIDLGGFLQVVCVLGSKQELSIRTVNVYVCGAHGPSKL